MSSKLRHILLGIFSLILMVSVFIVPNKANNKQEIGHVGYGFPFHFIYEDHSSYDFSFSFFPRYQAFEFNREKIVEFSYLKLFTNFIVIFIGLELLIFILENFVFWIKIKKRNMNK